MGESSKKNVNIASLALEFIGFYTSHTTLGCASCRMLGVTDTC